MKKGILLVLLSTILLVSACGKKEIITQPIPDVTQQYNYKENSVPVIDAIIDTEAEMQYIGKVQREYAQFATYYAAYVAKSSGISSSSTPQSIASTQQSVQSLLTEFEKFQKRIHAMNLPSDYKNALVTSITAYMQSLQHENIRLTEGKHSESKPSSALYQQAEEANKKVQQIYQKIRQS